MSLLSKTRSKMAYKHKINSEIATAYVTTKLKLTMVASLGVMIGIAVFIFLNSMMRGFERSSTATVFKTMSHLRIFKDDQVSHSLRKKNGKTEVVLVNPAIIPQTNTILNPEKVMAALKTHPDVTVVTAEVTANVFYNNAKTQINGIATGIIPDEAEEMYHIQSFMVEGRLSDLKTMQNGIILGIGLAEKMNVRTGDNVSLVSSKNVSKLMKVVGIFETKNSVVDKTKSYIHRSMAQQLVRESRTYITDIGVNVKNPMGAGRYMEVFSALTGYQAEDWETANEQLMAANNMRKSIAGVISMTILLVAGFGIYNILNMTVMQKMNEIAILKAMGFKGGDVVRIFVQQALTIGFIGVVLGVIFAMAMVKVLQGVYIGGDIGYFPIGYEPEMFLRGILFGFIVTFFAGYIPARKAAKVDPVSILRK